MSDQPPIPASKIPEALSHPAVHKHIDVLQGVVARMAENSSRCKNWCISLVAGALVLGLNKDVPAEARYLIPWISVGAILVFWVLDAYYHTLERGFRRQEEALVNAIYEGGELPFRLLLIKDRRTRWARFCDTACVAIFNGVTGGFYFTLSAGVIVFAIFALSL
jgi:hypothetical protein